MSPFKFAVQSPPTYNALVVRGPKGDKGDTGADGPSNISDQTLTDLAGLLSGDGEKVGVLSAPAGRAFLEVFSQSETQSAITAALAAYTPTSSLAAIATSGSASDLIIGTLANARLSPQVVRSDFSYPDPAWVTSIAASKLTGTVLDARLSGNVPLKDAISNAFTGNLTSPRIYVSGSNPQISPSSLDGADNRTLILMGGGEFGPATRGPHITLAGLEASTRPGNIELATGLNGEIRMGGELGGGFVETLRIVSAGKAQFRNATWHGSITDGLDRVLYALNSTTYYKGHGTGTIHEWRNGSDSPVMTLGQLGDLSVLGRIENAGYFTTTSALRMGSFELQPFAINNAFIGDNFYYTGSSFARRQAGFASAIYFLSGDIQLRSYGTGSGGGLLNNICQVKLTTAGTFAIGSNIDSGAGILTGAKTLLYGDGRITMEDMLIINRPGGTAPAAVVESPAWDPSYLAIRNGAQARTAATSALTVSANGATGLNSTSGQNLALKVGGIDHLTFNGTAATFAVYANAPGITVQSPGDGPTPLSGLGTLTIAGAQSQLVIQSRNAANNGDKSILYRNSGAFRIYHQTADVLTLTDAGDLTVSGVIKIAGSGGPVIRNASGNFEFMDTGATNYTQVRAREYRLDANAFSRVAQLNTANGAWGGGYNFNFNSGTAGREVGGFGATGVVYNTTAIQWFSAASGSAGAISPRMTLSPTALTMVGAVDIQNATITTNQWFSVYATNGTSTGDFLAIESMNTGAQWRFRRDGAFSSAFIVLGNGPRLDANAGLTSIRIRDTGGGSFANLEAGSATFSGAVTSAFQSLSADPTTLDIPSGFNRLVKNTTSGEIRWFVNDAGVMKKSPAYI